MLKFCLFVAMLYVLGGAVWFLVFGRRLLRPVIRLPAVIPGLLLSGACRQRYRHCRR